MSPLRLAPGGDSHAQQGVKPLLLPPERDDGETYLLTKAAAEAMGVAVPTISQWRRRGLIDPVPGSPPRKPLYRLSDLRRAEQRARENYIAATGTDDRVRRLYGIEL